ncbi:unnamed protein product [Linum tenue]|uniref:Nudix hydrolase domain-containing protein n=1 Tax=Linum tenue TaxID=586396 RepID=A0AAV0N423_9ROSI|nr:unnamed protein product [Linum tenue]
MPPPSRPPTPLPPAPPHPQSTHLLLTTSHHRPNINIPDFFLTALSILFLFSSSPPSSSSSSSASLKPQFPKIPSSRSRRFFQLPSMSVSNSSNRRRFATPNCLSDWLKPRLASDSFASWGVKPGTKNVHNLWLEISQGETSLADSTPPIRTVNVVTVRVIGKNSRVLVESHQELSDGTVRSRHRPLSEKMKPDESPESAVLRAVREELGSVAGGEVRIVPGSYREKVEERYSASYPGLPARYVLYSVDAIVDGLPDGDFCTEEAEEYGESEEKKVADQAVTVRKHFWTHLEKGAIMEQKGKLESKTLTQPLVKAAGSLLWTISLAVLTVLVTVCS